MDKNLAIRWQNKETPFHGLLLYPEDLLPLPAIRYALHQIVVLLKSFQPRSTLFYLQDWHEHDGYISEAESKTWNDLELLFASDDALYQSRINDDYVRNAWYPNNNTFLLRYELMKKDEEPNVAEYWGDFELSGSAEMIAAVQEVLSVGLSSAFLTAPAKAYFDSRYSG